MQGLLADVNVQGHLRYLHRLLEALGPGPFSTNCTSAWSRFPTCDSRTTSITGSLESLSAGRLGPVHRESKP